MEKNQINIAEILKGCKEGTELYSVAAGKVELSKIVDDGGGECHMVLVVSSDRQKITADKYGRHFKDGEVSVYPSKSMRDWNKWQWKHGDLLVSKTGIHEVLFLYWENSDFTKFCGVHKLSTNEDGSHDYISKDAYYTDDYDIESADAFNKYVNTLQNYIGKTLDIGTLELKQRYYGFKTYDKVLVRDSADECWKPAIFIRNVNNEDDAAGYNLIAFCLSDGKTNPFVHCVLYDSNKEVAFTSNLPKDDLPF